MLRRRQAPALVVVDAAEQAAWDADAGPRPRRRRGLAAVAALLVVLLLLVAMLATRGGDDAGMVALGSTSATTGLAPVEDQGGLPGDLAGIGPGDTVPGGGPAGGDPAAAAAAAAAAGLPGAAGAGAAAAGAATGSGLGVVGGAGAGDGVPVPTTGPGGGGANPPAGGANPPAGGGNPPAGGGGPGTTAAPTPPPVPPAPGPACTISGVAASPNPVKRKGNGQLHDNVAVTFQASSCGSAGFQVTVKGLVLPAAPTGGGGFRATIDKGTSGWSAGNHTIGITGGGASATGVLEVRS